MSRPFVALDFETANYYRDSACAIGLVRVENNKIVDQAVHLIRPPTREFMFTSIHGIAWRDVEYAETFKEVWPKVAHLLEGVEFVAAHNASFDASVLRACCLTADLVAPSLPFACTVKLARHVWNLHPTKLSDVARHLGLELQHHEALSDARACAGIVIAAISQNAEITFNGVKKPKAGNAAKKLSSLSSNAKAVASITEGRSETESAVPCGFRPSDLCQQLELVAKS